MQDKDTNKNILQNIGVDINDEKIHIDFNKTKSFFQTLQDILNQKAQKMQSDIEQGKVDLDNIGLKVDNEQIDIDLNKTKNFIEDLGNKLNNFIKDLENSIDNISKKES